MSVLRTAFCFAVAALSAFAAGPALDGPPFLAQEIGVEWRAPTNRWPSTIWVHKTVPQNFSPSAVSNLMTLGGFTKKDQTHIEGQPPFKDKRLKYFANKRRTRHLGIFPPLGYLYYRDDEATLIGRERAKGVPTEAEAVGLALQYLERLGIQRSELVHKEDGSGIYVARTVDTRGWFDETNQEQVKEVIRRGVSFVRQVDGISLTGLGTDGGLNIAFTVGGKVASLQLIWRNFQRHELHKACSPAQMVERIKQGQAKVHPFHSGRLSGARVLTINKATPVYLGADGETSKELMFPFASLEGEMEFDDGRKVPIALKCPMLIGE